MSVLRCLWRPISLNLLCYSESRWWPVNAYIDVRRVIGDGRETGHSRGSCCATESSNSILFNFHKKLNWPSFHISVGKRILWILPHWADWGVSKRKLWSLSVPFMTTRIGWVESRIIHTWMSIYPPCHSWTMYYILKTAMTLFFL